MKLFAAFFFLLYAFKDALTVNLEVQEGAQSVVLPCQYNKILKEIVTVKWSRYDLNPDTVHQRREGDDLQTQNQQFRGRTSMRPDALDSLDFSLTLKETTTSDSSTYICSIIDGREEILMEVQLHVKEKFPAWAIGVLVLLALLILPILFFLLLFLAMLYSEDGIGKTFIVVLGLLVLLVVLAVAGGLLFHFLSASQDPSNLEVWEGTQSVVLPCQYSKVLEEIVTVTWSRLDLSPSTVHERGEGDILINQNKHYSGRTSMRPDALDSSIFSLILKEPATSDSGNYICSITDEGVEDLMKVQLHVRGIVPPWAVVILVFLVFLVLLALLIVVCYKWLKSVEVT